MTNQVKIYQINKAILETEGLLLKALAKHTNSINALEMEIKENEELRNSVDANDHAIQYCNECEENVNQLKKHMTKLYNMRDIA